MNLLSKWFKKNDREAEAPQASVEEFVSLVKVYFQSVMAVNLGVTNVNFVPDLALFKRMLKIPTQQNKLGLAEKARVRKVLMQDYGVDDFFFKEMELSVKKNCKTQQDIKSYYFLFQGFSKELFTLIGNLMQWKMQVPVLLKKLLHNMTEKTVRDILSKSDWKDDSVRKTAITVRQYKKTLGYSEAWITEFVYHVVLVAKKEKKKPEAEADAK